MIIYKFSVFSVSADLFVVKSEMSKVCKRRLSPDVERPWLSFHATVHSLQAQIDTRVSYLRLLQE